MTGMQEPEAPEERNQDAVHRFPPFLHLQRRTVPLPLTREAQW